MKQRSNHITDAVLLRTVAVSAAGILLCMAALAGTTWAWFTAQIRSGPNTIQCADYNLQMTVTNNIGETVNPAALVSGDYQVKLTATSGTGAYCAWTVTAGNASHTYFALTDRQSIVFPLTVQVDEGEVQLFASACWGTLSAEAALIPETGLTVTGNTVTAKTVTSPLTAEAEEASVPAEETTEASVPAEETTEASVPAEGTVPSLNG